MKQRILIDGYNLLYQFPELRKRLERDSQGARDMLVSYLASYAVERDFAVVVVFDGDRRIAGFTRVKQGIKIVFSKSTEDADFVIKKMIDRSGRNSDLVVVSSDKEIENYAKLCGVKTILSQRFARDVAERLPVELGEKYDTSLSQKEVDEWLQLFRKRRDSEDSISK